VLHHLALNTPSRRVVAESAGNAITIPYQINGLRSAFGGLFSTDEPCLNSHHRATTGQAQRHSASVTPNHRPIETHRRARQSGNQWRGPAEQQGLVSRQLGSPPLDPPTSPVSLELGSHLDVAGTVLGTSPLPLLSDRPQQQKFMIVTWKARSHFGDQPEAPSRWPGLRAPGLSSLRRPARWELGPGLILIDDYLVLGSQLRGRAPNEYGVGMSTNTKPTSVPKTAEESGDAAILGPAPLLCCHAAPSAAAMCSMRGMSGKLQMSLLQPKHQQATARPA
jgi:hypothetical protein